MTVPVDFPLVVLDCDGTLVDSQLAIHAVMAECFSIHGLTPPGLAAVRGVVGLSLDDAIARLLIQPCGDDPARMADTYRSVSSRIRRQGAFEEPLFPGARAAVETLSEAGCVLGIATGKSLRGLRDTLTAHDLDNYFTTLQTADRAPGKPDPTMLRQAMGEVGADPHATVMVGDTTYDMAMARAAGTYAVGVSWGYHDAEALMEAGAHRVLGSYTDLIETVQDLFGWTGFPGRHS